MKEDLSSDDLVSFIVDIISCISGALYVVGFFLVIDFPLLNKNITALLNKNTGEALTKHKILFIFFVFNRLLIYHYTKAKKNVSYLE
jgi:hypothetical protein